MPIELTIKITGYRTIKNVSQNGKDLEIYKDKDIYYFNTKDFINDISVYFI
jgi:hypothetical protein